MDRQSDLGQVMEQYGNSIYRMSYYLLQNEQDAQDILQETLIKYMQKAPDFQSAEHEKAWLLRVTANLCKDMLRFKKRNQYVSLEQIKEAADSEAYDGLTDLEAEDKRRKELLRAGVFALKEKYKKVIFLHYYEGYSIKEIADILAISESSVKKRLERGRKLLQERLNDEPNSERRSYETI